MVKQALLTLMIIFFILKNASAGLRHFGTFNVNQAQQAFNNSFCGGCNAKDCQQNIDYIAKLNETGYFNLNDQPIINNRDGIYDFDKYIVTSSTDYKFPGCFLTNKVTKGMVLLPNVPSIKGVILYYHPTTFGKKNCPTNFGPEFQAIGGLFASQGYAIVFPNLIGFENDELVHPHVQFPQTNVRTGVSIMNQLVSDLIWSRYKSATKLYLFVLGFSEGASYAIWTVKCIQKPDKCPDYTNTSAFSTYKMALDSFYVLRKTVGMDGAYDIKEVVYPFLMNDVGYFKDFNHFRIIYQPETNFAKSGLAAIVVMGYSQYVKDDMALLPLFFPFKFFGMECTICTQSYCEAVKNTMNTLLTVLEAEASQLDILKAIAYSALGKSTESYTQKYGGSNCDAYVDSQSNSVKSLVRKEVLDDPRFQKLINESGIVDFAEDIAIETYVFTLSMDSVVPMKNTINFESRGKKNSNVRAYYFSNEHHQVCDSKTLKRFPVDHAKAQGLANLFALHSIQ